MLASHMHNKQQLQHATRAHRAHNPRCSDELSVLCCCFFLCFCVVCITFFEFGLEFWILVLYVLLWFYACIHSLYNSL
jgi:uncharacterized membrane protein YqaE (UPF0057 family)